VYRYTTARDLDDALHAELRADGVLVVGAVHVDPIQSTHSLKPPGLVPTLEHMK
jgi:hypothetical protein